MTGAPGGRPQPGGAWTDLARRLRLALAALLVLAGCGYSFVGGVTNIPPGAKTIAINVFANHTPEPGVETDFTNDLVLEFNRGGSLKVAAPPADLTISGAIDDISVTGSAYSREVLAVQRRVNLRVSARLVEASSGMVLWEDPAISDTEVFSVSSSPQATAENRREAIRVISERIAFQIHNRALEGF